MIESKKLKVLLFDDCKDTKEMIEHALSSTVEANISYLHTDNVPEALLLLTSVEVDLIISEVDRPQKGNGLELLKSKKELGIDTPVIIFSNSTRNINNKLISNGAEAFFSKSEGIEKLLELVHKILEV
jgi:DNA-binding NtrC family response regulator